tara:strand:- start:492 stop:1244 length:753 start_codon:yes stop_codon:yes gene_type:complete
MHIKLDAREHDLYTLLIQCNDSTHRVVREKLDVGDIILCDENENERLVFERKTLYDLASSIKDGRYNEQSFRLNNINTHNHNIIYIIEGNFSQYNPIKGRLDKKTLYSALIAIQFFKGFSLFRTENVNETSELITNYANKLSKENKKKGFYEQSEDNQIQQPNYCEVMKKVKKNNISTENIGEIMLSNIPGVSSKSAIIIMKNFHTIKNLINELEKNDDCLALLKLTMENGSERKISKTCIENIKKFLLI